MPLLETTLGVLAFASLSFLILRLAKLDVARESGTGALVLRHGGETRMGALSYWMLWFGLPVSALLSFGLPGGFDTTIVLVLVGLTVTFNGYLTWEAFGLSVVLEDDGVTERRPWLRDRHLKWDELKSIAVCRGGGLLIRSGLDELRIGVRQRDLRAVGGFIQSRLAEDRRLDLGTRELLRNVS